MVAWFALWSFLTARPRSALGGVTAAAATVAPVQPPAGSNASRRRQATGIARARCQALLLVRVQVCLPVRCLKCGVPMYIIAGALGVRVRQDACDRGRAEMDQTAGRGTDGCE